MLMNSIGDNKKVWLASSSPRRLELIGLLGFPWERVEANAKEILSPSLGARGNAEKNAYIKAKAAVVKAYGAVLAVDTVVSSMGEVYGKPVSREDAYKMLRSYSGSSHEVISGVAIIGQGKEEIFSVSTIVTFKLLTEEEINSYLKTDEPYDKAGAYAAQGAASRFITGISGDFYNVVGFPVNAIYTRLKEGFGF